MVFDGLNDNQIKELDFIQKEPSNYTKMVVSMAMIMANNLAWRAWQIPSKEEKQP